MNKHNHTMKKTKVEVTLDGNAGEIWTPTKRLTADNPEDYKQQKAYLVALASCIRETVPGSVKHREILWVIKHQDRIRKCRKLIEQTEP